LQRITILAAIACKDYQHRRRRQKEDIAQAKGQGLYKGRRVHKKVKLLLADDKSYNMIVSLLNKLG
jgi:DNA invertase Pin-like site-specific DNA recombinase